MAKGTNTAALAEGQSVLPLEGEIDLHVSPRIAAALREIIAQKPTQLLVDLSRVTYVDSSGLAVLIEAMQSLEQAGGKFGIVGMQNTVRSIFEMARLDQVFRIFPDMAAASVAA
jgi:anti-sigma B factor antagonist